MLKLKNVLLVFSVLLITSLLADVFLPVNPLIYIGIILVFMILLTWGSMSIRSNFYMHSFSEGNRQTKAVALTFDDGPDEHVTPLILDLLNENRVKAAFFIIGSKAEQFPELIRRIDAEGHIIGGHSYSHHFFFDLFSRRHMQDEMKRTSDIVFSITGKKIQLFRPPYGVTNPTIARALKAMSHISIGWSLKSRDTVVKDEIYLLNRLITHVKNGDIILFHDNKPWVVKLLVTFIPYMKNKEFHIERLDGFLNIEAYAN
jgi:peptidoglycan/xylan/chitin deacetylase (PgdA/CDA1 family)